jgi:hypothetical protein
MQRVVFDDSYHYDLRSTLDMTTWSYAVGTKVLGPKEVNESQHKACCAKGWKGAMAVYMGKRVYTTIEHDTIIHIYTPSNVPTRIC